METSTVTREIERDIERKSSAVMRAMTSQRLDVATKSNPSVKPSSTLYLVSNISTR